MPLVFALLVSSPWTEIREWLRSRARELAPHDIGYIAGGTLAIALVVGCICTYQGIVKGNWKPLGSLLKMMGVVALLILGYALYRLYVSGII